MQLAIVSAGTCDQLQSLVGREIVVPAEKLGLAKKQEALQGTVVLVSQEESNCLWCTFSGNSKWYTGFVESVHVFCKQLELLQSVWPCLAIKVR